ncbi:MULTISPECIES: phosphoglycerate dehydrogenase [Pseudomonas]|uniref:Phosphoglycerate dehydrogenase n=1 Tax=Pseudomonas gingeri TaxID=117681 RepID=A0A7Y7WXN5_9PSED|nr:MULTISPECIES: phosphoglycerate dehydrogenase [Pseudomonas]MPQ69647.1 hydroxyacid dehydrogenase [Pseudomonas sp. MWU12-2323]NWB89392.1 phosphoglycerate dehydrogenase [Pseudomonas gingeri]
MKIVCTSPSFAKYSTAPLTLLGEQAIECVNLPADIGEDEFIAQAKGAQAAIVAFNSINARVLDALPELRIVCKHGVGVDNIDLPAARERKVWVCNVPDSNKHAVADYTFALLLASARKIALADQQTKAGEWPRLFGADVHGKTLGIIGLGNIGKEVARRAAGFSMQVIAHDPYPDQAFAEAKGIRLVALDALLAEADYVTLHIGLNDATHHLIGAERLALMKPHAHLINAARGGIIDENALFAALQNGRLGGAALDVFEEEPVTRHPLYALPNVIASPHIAGYTPGALDILSLTCVRNIVAVLKANARPEHVVNGL